MATEKSAIAKLVISAPNMKIVKVTIEGTAPYVQAKFSQKAKAIIRAKHEAGSTSKKGVKKEPRDFDSDYEGAKHKAQEGWVGIPASAFRCAMISACRLVGFKMTIGKLSVFVEQDGFDVDDGLPLIKIIGEPKQHQMHTRNETGVCDLRVRPMWEKWSADVRIRYDADQFTQQDVVNLIARAGMQVGIGEGRPDSRESAGLGWGLFEIKEVVVLK